jgi:hypothetical protein
MFGIRDTAYPQMKSAPSARELADVYTPNFVELVWAEKRTRESAPRVGLLALLWGWANMPRLTEPNGISTPRTSRPNIICGTAVMEGSATIWSPKRMVEHSTSVKESLPLVSVIPTRSRCGTTPTNVKLMAFSRSGHIYGITTNLA